MIVYRVSYYSIYGNHFEIHHPTKKGAIDEFDSLSEESSVPSILVEKLVILKPIKKNICLFLDGHSYVVSRETLLSEER